MIDSRSRPKPMTALKPEVSARSFSTLVDRIPPSGIRRFFDLVLGAEDVISLGVGEPDFVTPWHIRAEAIDAIDKGVTSYTSNSGLLELRQQIAIYIHAQSGAIYDPNTEVIVTNGVSEAVDIVFRTLLNPGDEVILPEPAYVCYAPLIQIAGGVVVPFDTSATAFIPDPESIRSRITPKTKALVICSPSNPTGRTIPKSTMDELVAIAEATGIWIISDEIYSELAYDMPFTSVGAYPQLKDRSVILNGFSKSYAMTGWRLGYLCGPDSIVGRALKIHQYSALCASIVSQLAAVEALANGGVAVEEMRRSYHQRRNLFTAGLQEIGLPTHTADGAFYCFPQISHLGVSSEAFAMGLLERERVAVVPGNVFGLGGEGFVRCCYATRLDQLKEALVRMGRYVSYLKEAQR